MRPSGTKTVTFSDRHVSVPGSCPIPSFDRTNAPTPKMARTSTPPSRSFQAVSMLRRYPVGSRPTASRATIASARHMNAIELHVPNLATLVSTNDGARSGRATTATSSCAPTTTKMDFPLAEPGGRGAARGDPTAATSATRRRRRGACATRSIAPRPVAPSLGCRPPADHARARRDDGAGRARPRPGRPERGGRVRGAGLSAVLHSAPACRRPASNPSPRSTTEAVDIEALSRSISHGETPSSCLHEPAQSDRTSAARARSSR